VLDVLMIMDENEEKLKKQEKEMIQRVVKRMLFGRTCAECVLKRRIDNMAL